MTVRVAAACVLVGTLVVVTALVLDWPLERAALLAPVLVVVAAATAGLFVLWGRIAYEQVRASKHPRLILGVAAAAVTVFVVLAVLGVSLPRE